MIWNERTSPARTRSYGGSICAGITVMGRIGVLDDDLLGTTAKAVSDLARELSNAGQGHPRSV